MRAFEELVAEAESADVTGWGFGWLTGRATEERPPWGYSRLLSARLAQVQSALDIDTGGGEVIAEARVLPGRMCVTETARHPVSPDWPEIRRVLSPGGHYLGQHVGPGSAFELIERFLGPLPEHREGRDPHREAERAKAAGLTVVDLRTARCRMEFFDVGAIVWTLRKCVWWVPDFSVARYRGTLLELDDQLRHRGPFVAYSTRHLIEVRRPQLLSW